MNMTGAEILKPVVALAIWTMVMLVWMYATRIPAITALKLDPDSLAHDPSRTLDDILPASVQWKSHNFNHLHEAPTVFYAIAIVLAIVGAGDGLNATLGWAYVAVRVVHSLVQATINKVMVRFMLFALSSLILAALITRAAIAVF